MWHHIWHTYGSVMGMYIYIYIIFINIANGIMRYNGDKHEESGLHPVDSKWLHAKHYQSSHVWLSTQVGDSQVNICVNFLTCHPWRPDDLRVFPCFSCDFGNLHVKKKKKNNCFSQDNDLQMVNNPEQSGTYFTKSEKTDPWLQWHKDVLLTSR